MRSNNNKMLQMIESFGPQLFGIKGSLSIWTSITRSNDQKLINSLIKITEEMDSKQKYDFAKRVLNDGFEEVVSQMTTNNDNNDNESEGEQTDEYFVNQSEDEESHEEESQEYDLIISSRDSYFDSAVLHSESDDLSVPFISSYTLTEEVEPQKSDSLFTILKPNEKVINESHIENICHNYSESQESQVRTGETSTPLCSGFSGNIISFSAISPITPLSSQMTDFWPNTSPTPSTTNEL